MASGDVAVVVLVEGEEVASEAAPWPNAEPPGTPLSADRNIKREDSPFEF